MSTQETVELQGAADVPGADTLYDGFTKINNNIGHLADGTVAGTSGAKQIGYYDGGGATTVQDHLDTITYPASGNTTASNQGTGPGQVFITKNGADLELRNIIAGTNVTISHDASNNIVITSGLANAANVTILASAASPYTTLSPDEIVIINTEDTAFTINLQAGVDKRILNIKNRAWDGTGASPTQNTTEVTIVPFSGEHIEDDRTGLPTTTTAIGPGSAMRVVFDAGVNVWSII